MSEPGASADRATYRYAAFISYRHVEPDRKRARWLHRALESYRVPAKIREAKRLPRRVGRVFRDEEELAASSDLSREIDLALEQSRCLIVVCSPRTPASAWVNQEVIRFREMGRDDRILALLIEGEPAAAFPSSLREIRRHITEEGGQTREEIEEIEPLAADLRPSTDESRGHISRLAKLRLLACVLGCRFDDLRQREQERRVRQLARASIGAVLLVAVMAALALFAFAESRRANAEKERADEKAAVAQAEGQRADEKAAVAQAEGKRADEKAAVAQAEGQRADERAAYAEAQTDLARHQLGLAFLERARVLAREKRDLASALTAARAAGLFKDSAAANTFAPLLDETSPAFADSRALVVRARPSLVWQSPSLRTVGIWVTSVCYGPKGAALASGDVRGTVRLWDTATGALEAVLSGHTDQVTALAFSADGARVVSGSADGDVRIWEASSGNLLRTLTGHTNGVSDIDISPDGGILAVGGAGDVVRLWSSETGEIVGTREGSSHGTSSIAFDPGSGRLAAGSPDGTIRLWDLEGDSWTTLDHGEAVLDLAFSPNGEVLASSTGDGAVLLWDSATGEMRREIRSPPAEGPDVLGPDVLPVEWAPDSGTLASAGKDGRIRLWRAGTGECLATFEGHRGAVYDLSISPDGRRMASGGFDKTLRVWDVGAGQQVRRHGGHAGGVRAVCFSPAGGRIASGGVDGTVRLWNVDTGAEESVFRTRSGDVRSLDISTDGLMVLVGCGGGVEVWGTEPSRVLGRVTGFPVLAASVRISPDGKWMAVGRWHGNAVEVSSLQNPEVHHVFEGHTKWVHAVAFAPSGDQLASAGGDGQIILWDLEKAERIWTVNGPPVFALAIDPDGMMLAASTADRAVHLRTMATGEWITMLGRSGGVVTSLDFHPGGGALATGADDGTVRLWDPTSAELLSVIEGHAGGVTGVSFGPRGDLLASSGDDSTVRLWDVSGSGVGTELKGHTSAVRSLSFSPDGRRLASGGRDNLVRVWDVASRSLEQTLEGHGEAVESVRFSPDGTTLASGGAYDFAGGHLRLWDVQTGKTTKILHGLPFGKSVSCLCFSPDGSTLFSGCEFDGDIYTWHVATGEMETILTGHENSVLGISFTPDGGAFASASRDGTIRVWDPAVGASADPLRARADSVSDVAYDSTGTLLAAANDDGSIEIWDSVVGKVTRTLDGHDGAVTSVAFSPDGRHLASGGVDRIVRVWDVETGQVQSTHRGHTGTVSSVAVSPAGLLLASGGMDSTIRLWRLRGDTHVRSPLVDQLRFQGLELQFLPPARNLYGTPGRRARR